MNDVSFAICDLVECLNRYSVDYLVGGSVSSSLNGIFRTTNDVDVLLERPLTTSSVLLKDLTHKFIVNEEALIANHIEHRAYNIFHEASALKIDLFPGHTEFHAQQLTRATLVKPPSSPCAFKIATAEDIVLAKLLWIKKSVSERQNADIQGVIRLNKATLDYDYLKLWAEKLNLTQSLAKFIECDL